jgi:hypothetical protein
VTPKLVRAIRTSIVVIAVVLVLAACGGGGGGSLPTSISGPTTGDRTTTTRGEATTTTRTEGATITEAPATTEESAAPTSQETAVTETTQEGDTGAWWLLVLLIAVVGGVAWLVTRRRDAPRAETWHRQLAQLVRDLDAASYSLVAGADPSMKMPDDRWAAAQAQSREARSAAATVGAGAPIPEARDAVALAAQLLGALEVDATAARHLSAQGAAGAGDAGALVPVDVQRLQNAMQRLRDMVASQPVST